MGPDGDATGPTGEGPRFPSPGFSETLSGMTVSLFLTFCLTEEIIMNKLKHFKKAEGGRG